MARILIVYVSHYGQTEAIARRIGLSLRGDGHVAVLLDAPRLLGAEIAASDAVVIGSPIRYGRHDAALQQAVHENVQRLNGMPNAFFSVSLSASRPGKSLRNAERCVEQFITATGFQPRTHALFGGALAYTRYPFWMRWLMRFISGREGGAVDTTRDHEYTDWAAVDRFAREFAALAQPARITSGAIA